MKTFLAFVIACLFWPSAANAQGPTDRVRANLIGPVKSVETYRIRFILKDGKMEEAERQPWYVSTYNIDGNKTEHVVYGHLGLEKYLYTYDTKGRCTGYEVYDVRPDNTHTIHRKHVYAFDDNSNVVDHKVFESDGTLDGQFTYKYDLKGNKIEAALYTRTGLLSWQNVL